MYKLSFIGAGNMASAIIKGICASKALNAAEIAVFDTDASKAGCLSAQYGVAAVSSAEQAANAQAVVFAVKPNILGGVLAQLNSVLKANNPLIISIAAGKKIEFIQNILPSARIMRVMPNINAIVLQAICAYCGNENITDADRAFVSGIFGSVGKCIELDEKKFPLFTIVAASSPAFTYKYIDALARAAVFYGLDKKTALEVAAQSVLGSAKMVLESEHHPYELIDRVCSPGGTTIEGIIALNELGFDNAVQAAVDRAVEKDSRL
jgi:pyrroline-5-carboxylate reductase